MTQSWCGVSFEAALIMFDDDDYYNDGNTATPYYDTMTA
jgi:hypothetical protein